MLKNDHTISLKYIEQDGEIDPVQATGVYIHKKDTRFLQLAVSLAVAMFIHSQLNRALPSNLDK